MVDEWTARLSDYVDDELDPAAKQALEQHLASCRACADAVAELRQVVARAGALEDRAPAADLWPGIAERIAPVRAPAVVSIGAGRRDWLHRRFAVSAPQLAAACVASMVVSGSVAWQLGSRSSPAARPSAQAAAEGVAEAPQGDIVAIDFADAQYDAAVADLQRALAAGRHQLDPETVRILEHNLSLIDQAIAQARRALAADPANTYLTKHLVDSRRRKLDLLRRAAALIVAANENS